MKKIVGIIISTVICLFALITSGCSAMYYCAGCTDKIARDTCASAHETSGCMASTCRGLSCIPKDCYNKMYIDKPTTCANEIRNNYDEGLHWCNACSEYAQMGSDTFINPSNYDYSYSYDWDQDTVAEGYYKAIIEVSINPNVDIENAVLTFSIRDDNGNECESKLFYGNVKAGKTAKSKATFVFKGTPGNRDPKLDIIALRGRFANK